MAAHGVMEAINDKSRTIVESDYKATDWKPKPSSKPVFKQPYDMISAIERALSDPRVVTKTDVKAIVENHQTSWINTLQSQIREAVESTMRTHYNPVTSTIKMASNPICSTLLNKQWAKWSDPVALL